ncbi:phosphoadenosine phosphosulfate reductase family protein [Thermoactinomyces sp. CICC 10521]|uniref:phosphoadenosine phosphosulfate reductase domain-containing protein n=1 Tax=Thermoactinomyces sp. CICC 10521 TaxID=2767426 RepID=UPI0018DC8305|nr:phosphoadenosine phosphosulfate reductase family protein [Thermoactinomyces sp. CICC 10521]MBH8609321.1 phosphoadenosine phosphosulfate reductase family protein [Thermoactinomyces sp. CICC 10521]
MLGKKQAISNDDWLRAMQQIEERVSKAEIDSLIDRTVEDVHKNTKGQNVAFGWSGGKDSLALQFVMEQAGIEACVFAMSNLEYPAFIQWVNDHRPPQLEIINTGQDLKWLAKNLHMLFPQDAQTAAKWFKIIQHRAQELYVQRHQLDMIILGRRKADGNYTGKAGANLYTNKKGITRYSPLRDWKHEHVLGLIHYYHIPLPPIYQWPNGFKVGTGCWPARQYTGSIRQGWREVYSIDPSIVQEVATLIPSAREFLKEET